jgi:hypothetical protein
MLTAPPINWYTVTWDCGAAVVGGVVGGAVDVVEAVSGTVVDGTPVVTGGAVFGAVVAGAPACVVVGDAPGTVVDCGAVVVVGRGKAVCTCDGLVGTSSADSA